MHLSQPKDPIRDVLKAMTGKSPPAFVKGYTCYNLSDKEWDLLQSWAVNNCKPFYLTGIGLLEAAHHQVNEAVSNGNIPDPGYPMGDRVDYIHKQFSALARRHEDLLTQYRVAILAKERHGHLLAQGAAAPAHRKASSKWRMRVSSTRS